MIRPIVFLLGWLVLALVAPLGCGGDGDNAGEAVSNAAGAVSSAAETAVQEAPKTITVDLAEENESGQSGTATLTPNADGTFDVAIELSQRGDAPQPAHIHEGTCPDVGDVAAPLNDVVGGASTRECCAFARGPSQDGQPRLCDQCPQVRRRVGRIRGVWGHHRRLRSITRAEEAVSTCLATNGGTRRSNLRRTTSAGGARQSDLLPGTRFGWSVGYGARW